MQRAGTADLTLMGGQIPTWLFDRMVKLSLPVVEAIIQEYGREAFLARLSNPFWFQSFGAVIGMDWNSSGVTTAVMSALKKSINPHARELGLYLCGGKGKESLQTPAELLQLANRTGLDGDRLVRTSKLVAKVDSAAVQDGFHIYLHHFVVSAEGSWSVIQQGMQPASGKARRYHWHSGLLTSFVEDPHTAICGESQGTILNLVDKQAAPAQQQILSFVADHPEKLLKEIPHLNLPLSGTITDSLVDLKKLGAMLWLAHEAGIQQFDELLLLRGLGPRTLESLALVAEVIHGTSARFNDPARFAFAHGGKSGKPFPVPTRVYDEVITTLTTAVAKAKIGEPDKAAALRKLTELAQKAEAGFTPTTGIDSLLKKENEDAWKYGGRTKKGFLPPPQNS